MLNTERTTETRGSNVNFASQAVLSQEATWYKDAIIYQLHVKSFFDSNNDGIGDFPGVIEKLDYIASLGVNTIWLLPFYPSPLRDDGYDIADYYGVHPDYGTIDDVKRFIDEAHQRGLRIITELVINHTSDQHPWFQRARKAPPGSPERDFYVWSDDDDKYEGTRIIFLDTENSNWTWDPEAKAYFWHRFYSHQPDLNFDNPEVLKAVIDAMNYWLDMGVDGLRLDAVPYLVEREGTNNENLPETHDILKIIRAEVDEKFPGRLLLAEANQWPEDTQEYFGEGDECHMAFHFPLMPRMYMALAQEDRFPITDILRQTPVIPENCQWAIFLRNHDELTLEMVTDRERDYLWDQYASEGRARLNLGIRRRLAPLMQRDRRRIELLNSLLFSMPGTPVIYYGDELSMGDNIYLGDRDGVRTPMQWSPDRNGGFSKADPSRLMLPAVMDPLYGYSAVNVEAQARDSHSILNWMRLMLDVRKQHPSFGRGSFKMLYPANRRILAYIREYQHPDGGETETILCLANMSRTAQAVELDLSAYAGLVPLEMTGGSTFPPIGELNYLLTLAPYGFYWFLLAHETKYPEWYTPPPEPLPDYLTLVLRSGVMDVLEPPLKDSLEQDILPAYLAKRRWFGAKGEVIKGDRLIHQASLPHSANNGSGAELENILLTEIEVDVGQHKQSYQIPMAIFFEDGHVSALAHQLTLARVRRRQRVGVLTDAVVSDELTKSIVELLYKGLDKPNGIRLSDVARVPKGHDDLIFRPTDELRKLELNAPGLEIRTLSVEQSNSSVIVGEQAVLKLLRRTFPGAHPEVDMSGALTEGGFANTAPLLGYVCRNDEQGEPTVLAVLQGYIPNQGNGWEWMLEHLDRLNEDRASIKSPELSEEVIDAEISSREQEALAELERLASAIGKRLGEMHCVLAKAGPSPAFSAEKTDQSMCDQWVTTVQSQIDLAFSSLQRLDPGVLGRQDVELVESLLKHRDELRLVVRNLAEMGKGSLLFRIHGDLHLGQILVAQDDAFFIDFEGEPTRPVIERVGKSSPFRDVAGVLRSLDYAAATASEHTSVVDNEMAFEKHQEFLKRFRECTMAAFVGAYQEAANEVSHAWDSTAGRQALISLFTLEKAAYEIDYEVTNRPDWVHIPLRGLAEIARRMDVRIDQTTTH
ncbi:maltose alpha-D-glucosyltransferase [Marinimicrobium sp. ABcell2]|uniref:maltose alpha-D-glucosyltransferase n=1 Tax=Marinimicrobium sp. ABcell2 TaxID=3069751 RepID=UPI0027AEC057|nr:maltose alpha-D-glucosyltransferase [Marinimicrobium sp. ABcell2]MDQ2075833.1 maltose alpha-D-glucosyltransferase [Marinimicrobium sp. ABcell2]